MTLLDDLRAALGPAHVLADGLAPWSRDWTGHYEGTPLAVLRPGSTAEVAATLRLASRHRVPVVPSAGRTGLAGAGHAPGALLLSVDRLRALRRVNPSGRTATVEAGVVLDALNDALLPHGLRWPLTLGARGSAMVGGLLATNAGGPNALRWGSARDLTLGVEAVLADGTVLDLLSELRKDNTGYALRHLLVGAEGTLGVITAATLRLAPLPAARATATVALRSLPDALLLLHRLQDEAPVEAFEYMPRSYILQHLRHVPGAREPFAESHEHNVLVELAGGPRDALPAPEGGTRLDALLGSVLEAMLEEGAVLDAHLAASESQRRAMWDRREAAGRIGYLDPPFVDTDTAVPLDRVEAFLGRARAALRALDPGCTEVVVAHLGDGNVHMTAHPTRDDPALLAALRAAIDDAAVAEGGTFSAEHGVGLSKRATMARHKGEGALAAMRAVKAALDPDGIMNPGKVLP